MNEWPDIRMLLVAMADAIDILHSCVDDQSDGNELDDPDGYKALARLARALARSIVVFEPINDPTKESK
jgi:hypothetical protein